MIINTSQGQQRDFTEKSRLPTWIPDKDIINAEQVATFKNTGMNKNNSSQKKRKYP